MTAPHAFMRRTWFTCLNCSRSVPRDGGLEADWGDCTIDENGEARCPECGYMMEDVRDAGDS